MTDILKAVRDGIMGALLGFSPEQWADEQRQQDVTNAVDRFLESNPDWKPSQQSAPAVQPIKDTKQKAKRIMKTLAPAASVFTPHVLDEAALARARAKCREIVTADPAAYSFIIESAPLRDHEVA